MAGKQLGEFFAGEGYTNIPSNLPEFTIFFRMENAYVNVFHVIDYRQDLYISRDQYLHIKDKIRDFFLERGISQIHILSLIVCRDREKARQLFTDDSMSWVIDPYENRLMVFEDQVSDFYGMRNKMECFLDNLRQGVWQEEDKTEGSLKGKARRKYNVPVVTATFVALNVLVFILCIYTGELLYNAGAVGLSEFMDKQEYYRVFTSLFLHWDSNHLFSNMLVLYFLGEVVEKYYGPVWYIILYVGAGIGGNLLSMTYEYYSGVLVLSAGASGAIFGVIGALFVLVVAHKGHLEQISLKRLVFMVVYSLYSGFAGSNINNAAHIGGFLSGIVIALVGRFFVSLKNGKAVQDV